MRQPNAAISTLHAVEFETSAVNPDGSEVLLSKGHNLILDVGMNMLALRPAAACTAYCVIGDGTTPTSRDSGTITFARTGTTVTASAGFFVALDVGRIFKFDTGERVRISAFTDSVTVETLDAGTIAAAPGTVWYVNEVGHGNALQGTYQTTGSSLTQSAFSSVPSPRWTHSRQFIFPPIGSSTVIREIGWAPDGGNLYGRALVPGGGDSLAAGQRYKVLVHNIVLYSDGTVSNAFSAGSGDHLFSTAGNSKIEYCKICRIGGVDGGTEGGVWTDGYGNNPHGYVLEPFVPNIALNTSTSTAALEAISGESGPLIVGDIEGAALAWPSSYVAGSWERLYYHTIDATNADLTNINTICFQDRPFNGGGLSTFRTLFDAPQTKAADWAVSFTWRFTWDRDMPN